MYEIEKTKNRAHSNIDSSQHHFYILLDFPPPFIKKINKWGKYIGENKSAKNRLIQSLIFRLSIGYILINTYGFHSILTP